MKEEIKKRRENKINKGRKEGRKERRKYERKCICLSTRANTKQGQFDTAQRTKKERKKNNMEERKEINNKFRKKENV